jgi:outer membrane protein assembly factor BamB
MKKFKNILLLGGVFFIILGVKVGFSYNEGIIKTVWKRYVGKRNYIDTCQPLIFGDKILHATNGDKQDEKDQYDKLYVFDKDGNLLWSFSSPDGGDTDLNGVVACKDYILVTSDEGYVYSLSWRGQIRWKAKVGKWPLAMSLYDINGDGVPDALVGSSDNYLHLFDGKTGREIWRFKTGDYVYSSPALGDIDGDGKPEVVFGSDDHNLYVLNGENGSLLWKFKTGKWIVSSPALGDVDGDGKPEVVFGSVDNYLYALNGENGSLLWKFKTNDYVDSSPAIGDIDGDGKPEVVFGSDDNNVYVLNGEDGSLLWRFKTGNKIKSSPALGDVDGDGKIDIVVA